MYSSPPGAVPKNLKQNDGTTPTTVDDTLRYRHSQFAYDDYDPPYVLYGMEVSREKLDTVLEFFEGRATIIEDFDEDNPGEEYPPLVEYRQKVVRGWLGMTVDSEDVEG